MQTQSGIDTVVAYFSSLESAEKAVNDLHAAGFSRDQIGFANYASGRGRIGGDQRMDDRDRQSTGSHSEGMWERIVHLFKDDDGDTPGREKENIKGTGDNNIDGSSEDRATLDRTSDNRQVTKSMSSSDENNDSDGEYEYEYGSWSGSLDNMGLSSDRSRYFEEKLSNGGQGALVTVRAESRRQEAEQILERDGGDLGRDSGSSVASGREMQSGTTRQSGMPSATNRNELETDRAEGGQRIQLLGEVLRVHKERVSRGEIRLRKEVVTENQNVQVPVTREELIIERRPGGEQPVSGDQTIGKDSEVRVPLSEERVQVEKRPVVREEVEVGKRRVESTKQVGDQVRHEELRVENDENVDVDDRTSKTRNRKTA
jgi:uncharacterized protein (TIGR02271 family)